MKAIVLFAMFAASLAAKLPHLEERFLPEEEAGQGRQLAKDVDPEVIRDEREGPVEADYRYALELSNGIRWEETGAPGSAGQSNKEGVFAFETPEGIVVEISYKADEGGYQPQGDVIPQDHEPPPHVARLLEIAEKQRSEGIQFDERGFRI